MLLRLRILIISLLSAVVVDVHASSLLQSKECNEENIKLGMENAELRLENFRLKGENYKLSQKNADLLVERQNCTAIAENVESISTCMSSIQQELKPILTHFKLNKSGTDALHEQVPGQGAGDATSKRVNSFMDELKSFINEQLSVGKNEELSPQKSANNEKWLNELQTARQEFVNATIEANNLTATLNAALAQLKTKPEKTLPRNCEEAAKGRVGVFQIEIPDSQLAPFPVYCDTDNWLVILRRVDGTVNFQRNWADYKKGFGELAGNFIMGLEQLHQITKSQCHELKVVLEGINQSTINSLYDQFGIADESSQYKLKTLGQYTGNMRDSLQVHKGMRFSTFDRDNDLWREGHCAQLRKGAWWYNSCCSSKLTGIYFADGNKDCSGILWDDGKADCTSYKYAKMLIRPKAC